MSHTLVVFYSYSGTCRRVAQLLASHHGWALGEIRDVRPRSGFTGDLRCLLDSLLRRWPAIRYEGPAPADFDAVVIVSPIWAAQMAGPMRTFLAENAGQLRRVAQITVMNATSSANAVSEATRLLQRPPVLATELLTHDIEDGSAMKELLAFGDALASAAPSRPSDREAASAPPGNQPDLPAASV